MNNVPQKSVYQQGQTPNMMGEAYQPIGKTDFQFKDFLNDEKNKVEEVPNIYFILHNKYLIIYILCFTYILG